MEEDQSSEGGAPLLCMPMSPQEEEEEKEEPRKLRWDHRDRGPDQEVLLHLRKNSLFSCRFTASFKNIWKKNTFL